MNSSPPREEQRLKTDSARASGAEEERAKGSGATYLTRAQALTVGKLADVFGSGDVRPHENDVRDWILFRSPRQEWCIDGKGRVVGFDDLPTPKEPK